MNSMKAAFRVCFVLALSLTVGTTAGVAQSTPGKPDPDSKPVGDPAGQAPAKPAAEELPDGPTPQASALIHPNGPTVVFDTSMGRITCQFYEKQAPKTVANFIALAEGTKD